MNKIIDPVELLSRTRLAYCKVHPYIQTSLDVDNTSVSGVSQNESLISQLPYFSRGVSSIHVSESHVTVHYYQVIYIATFILHFLF